MDYEIRNSKNLYIRLNEYGRPETCSKNFSTKFEYSKAKNILDNLPKTFKKMGFKVIAIPEIKIEQPTIESVSKKIIKNENYQVSNNVLDWVEKFGMCGDILSDAQSRVNLLKEELKKSDDEMLDILHIIEIENPKDLYGGWKEYKRIRENRERRREIKDELRIIENVITEFNFDCLKRDNVKKSIDKLLKRKYRFRLIEEDVEE